MKENITLKTLQRIRQQFANGEALTGAGISERTGMHYYAVRSGLKFLEEKGEIRRLNASTKGRLYIKK